MWGVYLTVTHTSYAVLKLLCGDFIFNLTVTHTSHAVLYGEFLLHTRWCFMCGVSLTHPVLFYVWSFSYTPHAVLCVEFLLVLHTLCCFMWGIYHSFIHTPCCLMWVWVSHTHSMLFNVENISYMPHSICHKFILLTPCYFMWGVSLTYPMLF